jgi:hypothetical protein
MINTTVTRLATGIFVLSFTADAAAQIDIHQFLDSRYAETARIAKTLWDYAEVGYQEEMSSTLLQNTLSAEGFEIEAGVAGIPTAFVASYGGGGPVIAILAEYDALPGITQDATPTRNPVENKGLRMPAATIFSARDRSARRSPSSIGWTKREHRARFVSTARQRRKAVAVRPTWCAMGYSTMSTSPCIGTRLASIRPQPLRRSRTDPLSFVSTACRNMPPERPRRRARHSTVSKHSTT